VLVENDQVKEEWKKYMEKLLNEENTWDNATTCEKVEGPCELIRRDEISKALRMMKKGKAAGPTGTVLEIEKVKIDAMQFGFMPGKGTTNAIFTVRQMQEKYGCKGKKLYFAFVDLEKHLIEYLGRSLDGL